MARIVVIGAGIGGLAVAARLSVKRHQVTIVEQAPTYGGKAGRFERDGFVFDTGPSLLTLPAVYRDLFLKTGRALEDSVDLQPVDDGCRYQWADGTVAQVPGVGPAAAARALGVALGGTADADWRSLLVRGSQIWGLTRRPVLETAISGPRDLLKLASSYQDIRTIAPLTSLRGIGRSYLQDPRLRMLLERYATYSGSDPRKAPAALATIPYLEQAFGSWHIGGGISQLSTALYERCLQRKVTINFGKAVAQVELSGGRVCGVTCADGSRIPADLVVSDADASHLYRDLLPKSDVNLVLNRMRSATQSFSGFVMMLAVRGRTPNLGHHNVWFPQNYTPEFDSVFSGKLVDDPAIYACIPDDKQMRPNDDSESWFVLINAARHGSGKRELDWRAPGLADRYADKILGLLATRGVDLRDRILWREIRTPADLEADTRAPGGAIYGTSSNGLRAAFLRPANQSPVPGLFLVGGSAHPGGGLPLVGLSAEIVANLIGRG